MSEIKLTKKTLKEMETQFQEWEYFLNNIIGILAFSFAISCLGTHYPSLNAFISFIFLSTIYYFGRGKFSQLYKQLRDKKEKTTIEKIFYEGATRHFLGVKKLLLRYTVFLLGYIFLSFVMLGNALTEHFFILKTYFYGR